MKGKYYYISSYKCSLKRDFNESSISIETLIKEGRSDFYNTLIIEYEDGIRKGYDIFLDNW